MTPLQIRILDDEKQKRDELRQKIMQAGIQEDISIIAPEEFRSVFQKMLERQDDFRKQGYWQSEDKMIFDETDILIVDNELRDFFEDQGIFTDADHVAYLARCFSHCKHIIIVNRAGDNSFDTTGNLSYLDQFGAFSDLEIGQDQLASKALWGTGEEEFHPWYWFIPQKWLINFDLRVNDAKEGLRENQSILEFFGLKDFQDWLPRRILQTLGSGNDYTFGEFVRSSSFALASKDRAKLPAEFSTEMIDSLAPVVAARLWKWLEFQLLPELDILVDVPHLVTRFPSLLKGDRKQKETWNAVVALYQTNDIPNLETELIQKYLFCQPHWLTRPAWYWRTVMNHEDIPDVHKPWEIEYIPFSFCEDTSRFVDKEKAIAYRTAVDSSFAERYIQKIDGIEFLPPQRLAM